MSANLSSTRRAGFRRGQSIVIAIGVLFFLVLLAGTFTTMIVRNLQRVGRQSDTEETLTQALAGIQFAANQFRSSPAGTDWRPRATEQLWRDPQAGALAPQRQLDPDFDWLDPANNGNQPFVRFANGRSGRFLLRVTYQPTFTPTNPTNANTTAASRNFDAKTGMLHIESIGRPGEFAQGDPTFLRTAGAPIGPFRKVEAYVPVGLIDQLWWITNLTGEHGPARLGAPTFEAPGYDSRYATDPAANPQYSFDPNAPFHSATLFQGGIRSDVDLEFQGHNVLRIYPARGEGLFVKGDVHVPPTTPSDPISVRIDPVSDNSNIPAASGTPTLPVIPGDTQTDPGAVPGPTQFAASLALKDSSDPLFDSTGVFWNQGHDPVRLASDENHLRDLTSTLARGRSIQFQKAPSMDQTDPVSGKMRWLLLTRDSGAVTQVGDQVQGNNNAKRTINTGWYGLTDSTVPPNLRAAGLYLDNFGDIQFPGDRKTVKDDWMRRGHVSAAESGWLGEQYTPSVVEQSVKHPVADVYLTARPDPNNAGKFIPTIRITRYDLDQRQLNLTTAAGGRRLFYDLNGSGQLVPSANGGYTRDFDYPQNGVFYAEGSIRVRGVVGAAGTNGDAYGRRLTIASGGTIYIEGNLIKARDATDNTNKTPRRDCYLGLLAHDYVTLNPTAFTRINPGADVLIEADAPTSSGEVTSHHYVVHPDNDLEFTFGAAEPQGQALVFVKHSAVAETASSETPVVLYQPSGKPTWPDWNADRYDFGLNPFNPAPLVSQRFYLFHQIPAGLNPNGAESNFQSPAGSPATNYERKAFGLQAVSSDSSILGLGLDATFRFLVGRKDGPDIDGDNISDPALSPNGQPYLLSRVAVLRPDQALPVKVEAVMYAYTGSWFIIPPPFFNDNPNDTRAAYNQNAQRAPGTYPSTANNGGDTYPFYNEPLNYDIEIVGAIVENMPAEPAEVAEWTRHLWRQAPIPDPNNNNQYTGVYDPTALPATQAPIFAPNLRYRFDADLQRMVRVREIKSGAEVIAWSATPTSPISGVPTVAAAIGTAVTTDNSYAEVLPLLPKLPSSALIYEGNPL